MQALSNTVTSKIDLWLEKFPEDERKSGIMQALALVQEENSGYLTVELMDLVAAYLKVDKTQVYEVASFYSMFEHKPVGKYKICICTNISCMLNNVDAVVKHLQHKLGINFNEVTTDGKFSLKHVECLGACGGAPVIQIGDKYHENITPEKIDSIIAELS